MPTDVALISAVVSVIVAAAATGACLLVRRQVQSWTRGIGEALAQADAREQRIGEQLGQVRRDLDELSASVEVSDGALDRFDARIDGMTADLAARRLAMERVTDRRLVPLTRLIRAVATAGRYALLWRKSFG